MKSLIIILLFSFVCIIGLFTLAATNHAHAAVCSFNLSSSSVPENGSITVNIINTTSGPHYVRAPAKNKLFQLQVSGNQGSIDITPQALNMQAGETVTLFAAKLMGREQNCDPTGGYPITVTATPDGGGGGGGSGGGGGDDGDTSGGTGCTSFTECLQNLNPTGLKSDYQSGSLVGTLLSKIFPIVLGLGGFGAVIIILISAFQFVTSSGNPESAAAARGRLIFALIGFIILALAFAILQIVDSIFLKSGVI